MSTENLLKAAPKKFIIGFVLRQTQFNLGHKPLRFPIGSFMHIPTCLNQPILK